MDEHRDVDRASLCAPGAGGMEEFSGRDVAGCVPERHRRNPFVESGAMANESCERGVGEGSSASCGNRRAAVREDEAVLAAITRPAASAASTVASATAGAAGAVVGTVSKPVQSLSDLVRGKPVEEVPVEEVTEEVPVEEVTEEVPVEEVTEEVTEEVPVEEAASDASEEPESES